MNYLLLNYTMNEKVFKVYYNNNCETLICKLPDNRTIFDAVIPKDSPANWVITNNGDEIDNITIDDYDLELLGDEIYVCSTRYEHEKDISLNIRYKTITTIQIKDIQDEVISIVEVYPFEIKNKFKELIELLLPCKNVKPKNIKLTFEDYEMDIDTYDSEKFKSIIETTPELILTISPSYLH